MGTLRKLVGLAVIVGTVLTWSLPAHAALPPVKKPPINQLTITFIRYFVVDDLSKALGGAPLTVEQARNLIDSRCQDDAVARAQYVLRVNGRIAAAAYPKVSSSADGPLYPPRPELADISASTANIRCVMKFTMKKVPYARYYDATLGGVTSAVYPYSALRKAGFSLEVPLQEKFCAYNAGDGLKC